MREPKAADIRAGSLTKSLRRLRKLEKLALIAPMLGIRFDDLKLREIRRKRQRAGILTALLTILVMVFSILLMRVVFEKRVSNLFEILDNIVTAVDQNNHGKAAEWASMAWSQNQSYRLAKEHEIERVVRKAFDLHYFRQLVGIAPKGVNALVSSKNGKNIFIGTENGNLIEFAWAPHKKQFEIVRSDSIPGEISALAYNDTSKEIVVGTLDGFLFRIEGGIQKEVEIGYDQIEHLSYSPSGEHLAIASGSNLFIWNKANGPTLGKVEVPDLIKSIVWSAEGNWIAATTGNRVIIWPNIKDFVGANSYELVLPKPYKTFHLDMEPSSHSILISATAIDTDSGIEAVIFLAGDFRDPASLEPIYHNQNDLTVKGRFLSTGEVMIYGSSTSISYHTTSGIQTDPSDYILPEQMVFQGRDPSVIAIDKEAGQLVHLNFNTTKLAPLRLKHRRKVEALYFASETNEILISGHANEDKPRTWNLAPKNPSSVSAIEKLSDLFSIVVNTLTHLAITPNQPKLVIGALKRTLPEDDNLIIWEFDDLDTPVNTYHHQGQIAEFDLAKSGNLLAVVDNIELAVILYDLFGKGKTKIKVPTKSSLTAVSILESQGQWTQIAVGDERGSVYLLVPREETKQLIKGKAQRPVVTKLRYSADGKWLAAALPSGIKLYNLSENFEATSLDPTTKIEVMNFDDDGSSFFAGTSDGQVLRWHLDDIAKEAFVLYAGEIKITALNTSNDGQLLAVGMEDGTITIWRRFKDLMAYLDAQ